jgi:hypothetical protein
MKPKPFHEELPNSNGEAIMDKEMIGRFRGLLAKRAKTTIWPPTPLKSLGRPKTVLNGKLTRFDPGNAHVCGLSIHGALWGIWQLDGGR